MITEEDFLKELCMIAYAIGYKQGYEEGCHQALQKPIRNLVKLSLLTDEQIASAMKVTVDYVEGIRETMTFE